MFKILIIFFVLFFYFENMQKEFPILKGKLIFFYTVHFILKLKYRQSCFKNVLKIF